MAEYIEREALWRAFEFEPFYDNADRDEIVLPKIDDFPAADVAPVVHGRWDECDWVKYDGHSECIHYPKAAWRCSNCCNAFKKELLWKDNYCPNCGAKMDLEGENNNG